MKKTVKMLCQGGCTIALIIINFRLNILFGPQQEMKKFQIKINNNKSKLQINRANPDQMHMLMIKNRSSKENSNNFCKVQLKEEKGISTQKFACKSNENVSKRPSITSQYEAPISPVKQAPLSCPKSKTKVDRRSSSLLLQNNQHLSHPLSPILNHTLAEFIKQLEQRGLLWSSTTGYQVASQGLRTILLFIITTRAKSKNQARFLATLINQEALDDFMLQMGCRRNQGIKKERTLTLCSRTIQEEQQERGVGGEIVKELRRAASELREELAGLEKRKQQLQDQIDFGLHVIRENQRKNLSLELQIQQNEGQLRLLGQTIADNQQFIQQTQAKKRELVNFVSTQSNLIAKEAAEYHKNLEIDLFQYSDYLTHHPLGRKDFEPSIFYKEIERMLAAETKETINTLTCENTLPDDKSKILRGFLQRLRHQYTLMIEELTRALAEKTKYVKTFTAFVHRWYENYLAKKEYLSGLAEAFSVQLVTLVRSRQTIEALCPDDAKCFLPKQEMKRVFAGIDKLAEIFGMGNSFY